MFRMPAFLILTGIELYVLYYCYLNFRIFNKPHYRGILFSTTLLGLFEALYTINETIGFVIPLPFLYNTLMIVVLIKFFTISFFYYSELKKYKIINNIAVSLIISFAGLIIYYFSTNIFFTEKLSFVMIFGFIIIYIFMISYFVLMIQRFIKYKRVHTFNFSFWLNLAISIIFVEYTIFTLNLYFLNSKIFNDFNNESENLVITLFLFSYFLIFYWIVRLYKNQLVRG